MPVELDSTSKQWLNPILKAYGKPIPNKSAAGGWELGTVTKGGAIQGLSGTLNASQDAYKAIMRQSIVPKVRPTVVVIKPKGATVPVVKGPRVMIGATSGVEVQAWVGTMVGRYQQQLFEEEKRRRLEEDIDVAADAAAAAAQAGARSATRVKQRTLTKKKFASRVRIHGHSRREGKSVRDFKRRSPKRMR